MGLEALAAKWRLDPTDVAYDDAPVKEPMRQATKPMQRRAPSADQKKYRREMARGQVKTAGPSEDSYTREDFGRTVADEFDRLQEHSSPAKSWNMAEPGDRHGGSGDAGGTSVSQSMSDSSAPSNTPGTGGGAASSTASLNYYSARVATNYSRQRRGDLLHRPDGSLRSTCPNTNGRDLARFEDQLAKHDPDTCRRCSGGGSPKEATRNQIGVANSTGQILLSKGDQIRLPTGQAVNIKNVRRHETSRDHYYVDTDMGTSLVPWSTQFDVVRGGQQEVLPGPGVSGGNFGDMPNLSGNVEQAGSQHQQQNAVNPGNCPACGTKGSLTRRGGKFQCSKCGFTQNPQGGGLSFSDSTQQYAPTQQRQGVIAQRCVEVLAQPDPNQEESL